MQQTKIHSFMKPTTPRNIRTIAKQRHAAALFKMLALSERYEAARTLEAELLVEASAAREVDRMRTMQCAANLEQLNSGKFEIIDVRYH